MGGRLKRAMFLALILVVLTAAVLVYLYFHGYICLVNPSPDEYPVRGIDISEHQKEINWEEIENSEFQFVFIKATEGKDHRDSYFTRNWESAKDVNIIRGAYHFFTFRSSGTEQARNFIDVVPNEEGCLPPTIDIEFGGNSKDVPQREDFCKELRDFIDEIEVHYQQRPILYVTYESYEEFIVGDFEDCEIWIRDLTKTPVLSDGRQWLFWQYNCRGRVSGIDGFADLNVFNGGMAELAELLERNSTVP
jgi:lysozyme